MKGRNKPRPTDLTTAWRSYFLLIYFFSHMANYERWAGMRTLPADIQQHIAELPSLFEQTNVRLAYLFGSLSRGNTGNDIDLALLTHTEPAMHLYRAICDYLGSERVDLVDLQDAPPTLAFEIIGSGRLLYAADEETCNNFEHEVLRQYKDTAWLRRNHARILRERMKQWLSNPNRSSSD